MRSLVDEQINRLTEEQIERRVERQFDRLDADFMAGKLTQEQYDSECDALNKWAQGQYERAGKRVADRIDGYDRDDLGESPDY